jgi:uncharacterized protein YndB with AHSA1/START domain
MAPDQIERETTIAAPVERVWSLLTQAEHIGTWFGDAGAEIDLRPGGALVLRWAEYGTVHGEVVAVEPHRRFAYRWAASTAQGEAELVAANSTLVEFTLAPEPDGTRLRVVESGFAALDVPEAERASKVEGNTEGWAIELGHLREHADRVTV